MSQLVCQHVLMLTFQSVRDVSAHACSRLLRSVLGQRCPRSPSPVLPRMLSCSHFLALFLSECGHGRNDNGAPHAFPKVTLGDLGELCSCPKVAEQFTPSCRNVAPGAEPRPKFGQNWPICDQTCLSNVGQTRPNSAQAWRNFVKRRHTHGVLLDLDRITDQ